MKETTKNYIAFKSPVGWIRVFEENDKVVALDMGVSGVTKRTSDSATLNFAQHELEEYFAGRLNEFLTPIDFNKGTQFQRAVWQEIRNLGFGKVISYSEIAKAIGKPLASRAVGGAVGANPIPLLVGCHRVLGAGGRITGYSGGEGLVTKKVLLKLENIGFLE